MDKSGVVRVKIEGDNEPEPTVAREEGSVPVIFVGTKDAIENAKLLLDYHLMSLKKVKFINDSYCVIKLNRVLQNGQNQCFYLIFKMF